MLVRCEQSLCLKLRLPIKSKKNKKARKGVVAIFLQKSIRKIVSKVNLYISLQQSFTLCFHSEMKEIDLLSDGMTISNMLE